MKISGWLKVPKKEKMDIAEIGDSLAENPAVQKLIEKLIDRFLFRKSFIIFSLVNACLIAGVFYIVNSLVTIFNLGAVGGLVFGIVLAAVGGFYILKQLIVNERRQNQKVR